jgi:hypothetical protein
MGHRYMKCLLIFVLLLAASAATAQSAAGDPDAIDFSAKLDTVSRAEGGWVLNAGLLNDDAYDDFFIAGTFPRSSFRYGGSLLFSDPAQYPLARAEEVPVALTDITGTGRIDLIGDWSRGTPILHKRLTSAPYFDSAGIVQLTVHGKFPTIGLVGVTDLNRDGIDDILTFSTTESTYGNGFLVYYGSPHIADSAVKYPDDSLSGIKPYLGALGTFSKNGRPLLFMAISSTDPNPPHKVTVKIAVLRRLDSIGHDTVASLSQTDKIASAVLDNDDSMISAQGMYAADITGDGISDLLISDDHKIYIFQGSDSLGYYPLTKDRAYYSIPNPRLLDWQDNRFVNVDQFGRYMHACGDLTGSGIPYLMVLGNPNVQNFSLQANALFYAGGKALDSLYDAVVSIDNTVQSLTMDTLHSVDNSGRTSVLLFDQNDQHDGLSTLTLLLHKESDRIPHKTNPRLSVVNTAPIAHEDIRVIQAGNYIKLNVIAEESNQVRIVVQNILGQQIFAKDEMLTAGDNLTYIETHSWASGTYLTSVTDAKGSMTTKFTIIRN